MLAFDFIYIAIYKRDILPKASAFQAQENCCKMTNVSIHFTFGEVNRPHLLGKNVSEYPEQNELSGMIYNPELKKLSAGC